MDFRNGELDVWKFSGELDRLINADLGFLVSRPAKVREVVNVLFLDEAPHEEQQLKLVREAGPAGGNRVFVGRRVFKDCRVYGAVGW